MNDHPTVQCPYCLQWVEIALDPETRGTMVQDCEICCRPWQIHVDRDEQGDPILTVTRAQ